MKERLEINLNDQKKFWKHIQEVKPNNSKGNKLINLKDTTTDTLIGSTNTADYINKFYISNFTTT